MCFRSELTSLATSGKFFTTLAYQTHWNIPRILTGIFIFLELTLSKVKSPLFKKFLLCFNYVKTVVKPLNIQTNLQKLTCIRTAERKKAKVNWKKIKINRSCNDHRSNNSFLFDFRFIFIPQQCRWKFWSYTCHKGHIKLHWSSGMASSCYLQVLVWNRRRVLSIRWTDVCYEIWVVDVWWISGEFMNCRVVWLDESWICFRGNRITCIVNQNVESLHVNILLIFLWRILLTCSINKNFLWSSVPESSIAPTIWQLCYVE